MLAIRSASCVRRRTGRSVVRATARPSAAAAADRDERDEQEQEPDPREGVVDLAQRAGDLRGGRSVEPCRVDAEMRAGDGGVAEERPALAGRDVGRTVRREAGALSGREGDLAVPVDELDVARGAAELARA